MLTGSVSAAGLEKAMSLTWERMQTISHNIINEDTPGYKAQRLEFEQLIKSELDRYRSGSVSVDNRQQAMDRISSIRPITYSDESTIGRADGNNVLIENEQIELARVQIQFDALEQRIKSHNNLIKYAISGGR